MACPWGLQYTLLSVITKLPTVKSRLQTEHLTHCLWSTLLSKLHFSIWYTVLPHTTHLSDDTLFSVEDTWLRALSLFVSSSLRDFRNGTFLSTLILDVLLPEWGASGEFFLFVTPCGLIGNLGFSLTTGFSWLPLLPNVIVGEDDESVSRFSDAWNRKKKNECLNSTSRLWLIHLESLLTC